MRKYLPPEAAYWAAVMGVLRDRIARERGAMSAELMLLIAGLALIAVTVMGLVGAKIIAAANSLQLGTPAP